MDEIIGYVVNALSAASSYPMPPMLIGVYLLWYGFKRTFEENPASEATAGGAAAPPQEEHKNGSVEKHEEGRGDIEMSRRLR